MKTEPMTLGEIRAYTSIADVAIEATNRQLFQPGQLIDPQKRAKKTKRNHADERHHPSTGR